MDGNADKHDEPVLRRLIKMNYPKRENQAPTYLQVLSYMGNLNTPFFLGSEDPLDANAWFERLKRNFNSTRCPVEFKMDIAVHFLDGNAILWWYEVECGKDVKTWIEFENEFKLRYLPLEARDRIELQYIRLVQGSKSVREYELEFCRLRHFLRGKYDNEQAAIRQFTRGLRPDIRQSLAVIEFHRLVELVEKATLVEEGLQEEEEEKDSQEEKLAKSAAFMFGSKASQSLGLHHAGTSIKKKSRSKKKETSRVTCFRCGEKGHYAVSCPQCCKSHPPSDRLALMPPPKRQDLGLTNVNAYPEVSSPML